MADRNSNLPPSEEEVNEVLERIKAARAAASSPADTAKFDQAEQEARDLYNERASRAEWLSVADRIGNALTKIGAARAGMKHGVDMSGIKLEPGTDWDQRIGRYAQDYTTELSRIGRQRDAALSAADKQASLGEKAFEAAQRNQQRADDQQYRRERDEADTDWKRYALGVQEGSANRRLNRQIEEDRAREERAQRKTQLDNLNAEEKALKEAEGARTSLLSAIANLANLGGKARERAEAGLPELARKAGMTVQEAQTIYDTELNKEENKDKGIFWDSSNPTKASTAAGKTLIDPLKKRIQEIQAKKAAISGVGGEQAPAQSDTVRVRNPQGQVGIIPRSQLKDALNQGYTEVE